MDLSYFFMLVSHLAAEKVAVLVFVEYKKQRKIIEFAVLCLNTFHVKKIAILLVYLRRNGKFHALGMKILLRKLPSPNL